MNKNFTNATKLAATTVLTAVTSAAPVTPAFASQGMLDQVMPYMFIAGMALGGAGLGGIFTGVSGSLIHTGIKEKFSGKALDEEAIQNRFMNYGAIGFVAGGLAGGFWMTEQITHDQRERLEYQCSTGQLDACKDLRSETITDPRTGDRYQLSFG